MPSGDNKRKLSATAIDEIVRLYTTPLDDGTWLGTTSLGRRFGVRPATINRWLRIRGVQIRSARKAHSNGKRCRPITRMPQGPAPLCRCGCGEATSWHRKKNRWHRFVTGHYRQAAPYKDMQWLRTEYIDKRRTLDEIAAECGVCASSVTRYMARFGIPRRDGSAAHMGRQVGPLNPAWKGGVADWSYSSDWKVVARQIRDRDQWTCQDCGERRKRWGVGLHVHHIDGDKLNNTPANLISLCAACHKTRHLGRPS